MIEVEARGQGATDAVRTPATAAPKLAIKRSPRSSQGSLRTVWTSTFECLVVAWGHLR